MRRGSLANRRGPPFPAAPMPCSRASGTSAVLRSGVPYSNRAAGDRARATAATTSTRRPRHDRLRHHSTSGSICRIENMRTIRTRRMALARPEPGSRGEHLMPDTPDFPIVDRDKLLAHRSGKALKRILTSPQSEDWVTWTVMRLLRRTDDSTWWPAVIDLAAANGAGSLPRRDAPPTVTLWRSIPAPPEYERRSRARMAESDNPRCRKRARNPRAVEGPTEVDIALDGTDYSIFIEAKLLSDICKVTTPNATRYSATSIARSSRPAAGRPGSGCSSKTEARSGGISN